MRATFKQNDLQREFEHNGYVILPCLNADAISALSTVYDRFYPDSQQGFGVSITRSAEDRRDITGELVRHLTPTIEEYFDGHSPFIGNFVVKWPGAASEVGPHQDWSFVDERSFASLNIWCPLIDTDENNGALCVVPGSHTLGATYRGSPHPFDTRLTSVEQYAAEKYGTVIPVKAGQAIAYDHQLIHYSPPNTSDEPRVAVAVGVAPAEAELVHYFKRSEGAVEAFRVNPGFYLDFNIGDEPAGVTSLGMVDVDVSPASDEQVDAQLGTAPAG